MSSPSEWYAAIPPVTKAWFTSAVALGIGARFGWVAPKVLALDWDLIINKLQVWRLLGAFVFFGGPSFGWLMTMMMLSRFSMALELSPYPSGGGPHNGNVADFLWMLVVGAGLLLGLGSALGARFLAHSLFMMVIYAWSKRHPGEQVTFYMFRVAAQYLPWVMLGFAFIVGDDITMDLLGIFAGHVYYFLQEELPAMDTPLKGWRLLRTPEALCRLCDVQPTHAAAAFVRLQQRAGAGGAAPGAAPPARREHVWGQGNVLGRG